MLLGLTLSVRPRRHRDISLLINLSGAYALIPAVLALPVEHLVPSITYSQAYFEMVSSMTTTGATIFPDPRVIADPIHLWRGVVSWAGGLLTLVAAFAILQPMNLGGFEIQAAIRRDPVTTRRARGGEGAAPDRLRHYLALILPPYLILTLALTLGLLMSGDRTLVALVHAMSVVSTSGISPLQGLPDATSSDRGEVLIFLFLLIAINHRATSLLMRKEHGIKLNLDAEYRIALVCVMGVSLLLFFRHFIGAFEIAEQENVAGAFSALWGGAFTTLSFLSTTGFESTHWDAARNWSGLNTPGIVLLGLCLMGGGIATTAGGVKLLRIYALYKHGQRELQRLVHPNSVGGAGVTARRIRREGAGIAWVFLMLFLIGVAVLMLLLTLAGIDFETSISLGIASLSNTGPAARLLDPDFSYSVLSFWQLIISGGAMVLGRVELLVFLGLLNPEYWRQ